MSDITSIWEDLAWQQGGCIIYLVIDGVGGLVHPGRGGTELQVAKTPHLDALARASSCGLLEIVGPGITPGSGPGHLSLFGYNPLTYKVGRGVLSALGIDFDLQPGDVAARANFATLDSNGHVKDRRAGRIATELNQQLCQRVREAVNLESERFFFETVSEHRAVLVLRGEGLGDALDDTDPQQTGMAPAPLQPRTEAAQKTAALVRSFLDQATAALAEETQANGILLRGFERYQPLPSLKQRFGLRGICIADYPMYRGVSRLIGMDVVPAPGGLDARIEALRSVFGQDYDFYFVHVKKTDSYGEDAAFDKKVALLEHLDTLIPQILDLAPDVLVVTADHSTPAVMGRHSWHPVPVLLNAKYARIDPVEHFDEYACAQGMLGCRPGIDLIGLALANAGRLRKYGA